MKLHSSQRGLVSLVVTMMLMIVLSIVVLGYAQTIRREQKAQLDRQLSARAFYAAESGVNLARSKLVDPTFETSSDCGKDEFSDPERSLDDGVSGNADAKVTCLTVESTPTQIDFGNIGMESEVFPIQTDSTIGTITFRWHKAEGGTAGNCESSPPTAANRFPAKSDWDAAGGCGQPVLRVDLVDVSTGFTQANLPSKTATFFLYPLSAGGTGSFGFASADNGDQGYIHDVTCSTTCQATVHVSTLVSNHFAARVTGIYHEGAAVSVWANGVLVGGGRLPLKGVQAAIDSTARSQDVVRRVRVSVPLRREFTGPDYTLAAGEGICKRLEVSQHPDPAKLNEVTVEGLHNTNPICQIN